jgi:hypothetical protein
MADLKRLTSNCTKKTQTKYLTRGSPPYSASDCKTMKKKGNDGNFYVSTADKNGTYKWTKAATNKIKAKATAKTVKAKPTSEITMAEIQDIIKRNGMITTGTKKGLANSIYSVYKIGKEYGTRKIKITQKEKNKIESFLFGL